MRILIATIVFVFVLLTGVYLLGNAPFHFYELAVKEGVNGRFFKTSGKNKFLLAGNELDREEFVDKGYEKDVWKKFHFSNVELPFPILHPLITTLPIMNVLDFGTQWGGKFINRNKDNLVEFKLGPSKPFKKYHIYQKLFRLPFFKNRIRKISSEKLWEDLFLMKIPMKFKREYRIKTFFSMMYSLYILNLRKKTFPKNILRFSYDRDKKLGVFSLKSKVENFEHNLYYMQIKGEIYPFSLISSLKFSESKAIKQRILRDITYKKSSPLAAEELYSRFQLLPFRQKIDTSGIVFLFVGLTHVPSRENYLRHMINFLERGDSNLLYLSPLYDYAYEKFGSNFSGQKGVLSENTKQNLETKIREETQSEINAAKNYNVFDTEGEFKSLKAKRNFFLQKAKDLNYTEENDDEILFEN